LCSISITKRAQLEEEEEEEAKPGEQVENLSFSMGSF
jgi:hypothetical protein